ncbi:GNAT family N-acetyltransferase [Nocardia miyunensis]|uniref:GNAT family N-acetyltransferase n=1 Tax=Nocardia miyunensis TaxID=282684 RepID=UPI00082AD3B1|nr:GNAT family N-acetyltransferase [Nocardia miyunensis]
MVLRFPDDVPVLSDGGSLVLRTHRPEDLPAIVEQCVDPDMVRYTTIPRPYTERNAQEFLELAGSSWTQHTSTSRRIWAVTNETRFAGTIDYRPSGHGTAVVGFGLHPDHRGHGLMSRALSLVLDYAFGHDGQKLMTWRAIVGNWGSAKTAWHNGFRLEGRVRGLCVQPDGAFDGWIATLAREDPRTPCQPWPWPTGHQPYGIDRAEPEQSRPR